MLSTVVNRLHERLKAQQYTKILYFGSSNTERICPGGHWSDVMDLALGQQFGRHHRTLNMGIGGNTSSQLLERVQRDVLDYAPHVVFITVGGNDSNPDKDISPTLFRENLLTLKDTIAHDDCDVIFQTYYAHDDKNTSPKHEKAFVNYMQIIRDVAQETNTALMDNFVYWVPFRDQYYDVYSRCMRDNLHLNNLGNSLFGLNMARHFDLVTPHEDSYWEEARSLLTLMDNATKSAHANA